MGDRLIYTSTPQRAGKRGSGTDNNLAADSDTRLSHEGVEPIAAIRQGPRIRLPPD